MRTLGSAPTGPPRSSRTRTAARARSVARGDLDRFERTIARCGWVNAIDLCQIHRPIPAKDIKEGWAALAELRDQGLVRHIGVSNFDVVQLRRVQPIAPVETLQPQYSLIERDAEHELLPFADEQGIGVIVHSPMGSGMLTGG